MDDTLPQKCRWVFWGRPSLVHPDTGVVFAVAFGTIGIVLRLSPEAIEAAGCFGVVLEGIPDVVAEMLTDRLSIPTTQITTDFELVTA